MNMIMVVTVIITLVMMMGTRMDFGATQNPQPVERQRYVKKNFDHFLTLAGSP